MSDDADLLAAIRAAPDDDAPRLVFADWLDEHGHPERAEFIRVQCERARAPDPELYEREERLWNAHHDKLAGQFAAPGVRYHFERGFITGFGHTGVFGSLSRRDGNMLRFFPDGQVARAAMTRESAPIPAYFAFDNPYLKRGYYLLDSFGYPATIKLRYGNDPRWSYQGEFDGKSLSVAYRNRRGRHYQEMYSHIPISRFDSYTT